MYLCGTGKPKEGNSEAGLIFPLSVMVVVAFFLHLMCTLIFSSFQEPSSKHVFNIFEDLCQDVKFSTLQEYLQFDKLFLVQLSVLLSFLNPAPSVFCPVYTLMIPALISWLGPETSSVSSPIPPLAESSYLWTLYIVSQPPDTCYPSVHYISLVFLLSVTLVKNVKLDHYLVPSCVCSLSITTDEVFIARQATGDPSSKFFLRISLLQPHSLLPTNVAWGFRKTDSKTYISMQEIY